MSHNCKLVDGSQHFIHNIIKCFYVDDYLDSFKTVEKAREVRIELTEVLRKGGFELCKWNSSDKRVLEDEKTETEDTKEIEELEEVETTEKVLGVKYSFKKDEFFFAVKPDKINLTAHCLSVQ